MVVRGEGRGVPGWVTRGETTSSSGANANTIMLSWSLVGAMNSVIVGVVYMVKYSKNRAFQDMHDHKGIV